MLQNILLCGIILLTAGPGFAQMPVMPQPAGDSGIHNIHVPGNRALSSGTGTNSGSQAVNTMTGSSQAGISAESHLPLVVIDTGGKTIVNEPKITVTLKVIDHGGEQPNKTTDQGNQFEGPAGIEIRGQSSQMFPKKSYGFETRDPAGDDSDASLMGMPSESDWVLYAPYSDKTMLRNALTFYLGRKMGRWQPGFRFCEVYINDNYAGVYQLTEKIKRNVNRVDISKLEPSDISGDDLTGGYIIKVDKISGISSSDYFYSSPAVPFQNARKYAFSWVYPESGDLKTQQKDYLKNFILGFQNALNGPSFSDVSSGYRNYIDVASFIDFQIMNEFGNNVDGYRYSTFFHKQKNSKGGKLHAGPLWDFDLSYGNLNYSWKHQAVDQWSYMNYGPNEPNCMHWWARLMQDPDYEQTLKARWTSLRKGILHTDSVMEFIDKQVTVLGDAIARNFVRWQILGVRVWPNDFVGMTYESEIGFLKDWITRRLNWIDTQWLVKSPGSMVNAMNEILIFPNPVRDELRIVVPDTFKGDPDVDFYDTSGRKILHKILNNDGNGEFRINVSSLQRGIFLVRISGNGHPVATKKMLKQ